MYGKCCGIGSIENADIDIVMTDVNWHYYKVSGIAFIKDILNYKPDIKIIGVMLIYEEKIAKELQQLGVAGYIYRNVGSIDKIVDCIERVHIGERYFVE